MLEARDRRQHNEFAQTAALHGIKVPFRHNHILEAAQEAAEERIDPALEQQFFDDAQARVKARYGK